MDIKKCNQPVQSKAKTETIQEFLDRGGKITVLPPIRYVPSKRNPVFSTKSPLFQLLGR